MLWLGRLPLQHGFSSSRVLTAAAAQQRGLTIPLLQPRAAAAPAIAALLIWRRRERERRSVAVAVAAAAVVETMHDTAIFIEFEDKRFS